MDREVPSVWDRVRHHPDAVPVPGERVELVSDPPEGKETEPKEHVNTRNSEE